MTFSSDDEAKAAIEKFQDFEFMGRNLTVMKHARVKIAAAAVVVSVAAEAAVAIAAAAAAAVAAVAEVVVAAEAVAGSWRSWWRRRFPRQRQLVNLLVPEQAHLP